MADVAGKTALITGAEQGLGAVARVLRGVLELECAAVIPEMMVIPMMEASWP
jgi:hypothetical protein